VRFVGEDRPVALPPPSPLRGVPKGCGRCRTPSISSRALRIRSAASSRSAPREGTPPGEGCGVVATSRATAGGGDGGGVPEKEEVAELDGRASGAKV